MKIIIKPDSDKEDANKLYNLIRNGVGGQYILQTVTQDRSKGEYIFNFKEKKKD